MPQPKSNGFRLDGKSFSTKITPPRVLRTKAFVEKLPDNELLTSKEVAKRLGMSASMFNSEMGTTEELQALTACIRFPTRQRVWGNAFTIRELRKHKELILA